MADARVQRDMVPMTATDPDDDFPALNINPGMMSAGPAWERRKQQSPPAAELDPADPIDAVLIEMHNIQRAKRKDYAFDGNPFSNFEGAAVRVALPGVTALEIIEVLIAVKDERLAALGNNGRAPANEGVLDTYLDRAVYSAIALAYLRRRIAHTALEEVAE
jgi:hypothetical protein